MLCKGFADEPPGFSLFRNGPDRPRGVARRRAGSSGMAGRPDRRRILKRDRQDIPEHGKYQAIFQVVKGAVCFQIDGPPAFMLCAEKSSNREDAGIVMTAAGDLKREITSYMLERGADLVGFAAADRWHEDGRVPVPYRPDALWPRTRTVIVLGIQMPLPVVETTPSVQHRDLYNACNRTLDDAAFSLARWLNRRGHAAIPLSRDGYANIHVLIQKPAAAFSHGLAAHYSGIGHKGINNTVLTDAYGPRVRFASVFTAVALPADPAPLRNRCVRCGACVRLCPVRALRISKEELADRRIVVADYSARACAEWARVLTEKGCYPCGICIKVCPVGEDRILYGREKTLMHYRREADATADTQDPDYRAWAHIRAHGSLIPEADALSLAGLRPAAEKIIRENGRS